MKKFLPSKKFLKIAGSFLVVGIILFIAFNFIFSKKNIFSNKKEDNGKIAVDRLSALKLVQQDSDGDGVSDWEEALWGTNKNNMSTFDGVSDLKYIENKKKELNIKPSENNNDLTETDIFAREFFATYIAMKDSGQMDNKAINEFSKILGQKIANPTIIDQYIQKDIVIDNTNNNKKYYSELKNLFDKYRQSDMGEELVIINNGLTANYKKGGGEVSDKILEISGLYKDFASKAIKIAVPNALSDNHLNVINNANNIGISLEGMAKISTDPIVGLSGLSQYQKYSDEFMSSAKELETKALE